MNPHYTKIYNLQIKDPIWIGTEKTIKTFYDEWEIPIDRRQLHEDVKEHIGEPDLVSFNLLYDVKPGWSGGRWRNL